MPSAERVLWILLLMKDSQVASTSGLPAVIDRPKTKKKFHDNIDLYRPEGDFSEEEIIQFKTDLTGVFPMSLVVSPEMIQDSARQVHPANFRVR